jgi:hypothetical protein
MGERDYLILESADPKVSPSPAADPGRIQQPFLRRTRDRIAAARRVWYQWVRAASALNAGWAGLEWAVEAAPSEAPSVRVTWKASGSGPGESLPSPQHGRMGLIHSPTRAGPFGRTIDVPVCCDRGHDKTMEAVGERGGGEPTALLRTDVAVPAATDGAQLATPSTDHLPFNPPFSPQLRGCRPIAGT